MQGVDNSQVTGVRRGRLRRWLADAARGFGLIGCLQMSVPVHSAKAQGAAYLASKGAPSAWQEFAARMRNALQERLTADHDVMQKLHELLDAREAVGKSKQHVVTRIWVTSRGDIDRLEFSGVDGDVATLLRGVLVRERFGMAPPPDMLQPVHLRLSLSRDE